MEIISHRGFWKTDNEKNRISAFERSFSLGFGTETDIRDYKGELVISHDIADENAIKLERFFELFANFNKNLPLALNIKADGLHLKLKELLLKYEIKDYFVFDMSVPDALGYLKNDIKTFSRESEHERVPSFYEQADGMWLDEFYSHWINEQAILRHVEHNKRVCIVSPDLHKRNYQIEWQHYKEIERNIGINSLMLCTDNPEKADRFFNE